MAAHLTKPWMRRTNSARLRWSSPPAPETAEGEAFLADRRCASMSGEASPKRRDASDRTDAMMNGLYVASNPTVAWAHA